jgi:branched-subunit amino acid transport protein
LADAWLLFACLVLSTALVRAAGPVVLGGRELPDRAAGVIALLAPALLAALVVTETFRGEGSELTFDARVLGVAAAGVALALRSSVVVAMAVAMAVTAGVRALS